MSLLQWDHSYVTGIRRADHEHRNLVNLINRLHRGFEREKTRDPAKFFDDLFNLLLSHFQAEERMMGECGYAGHPAHAQDHERILDELRDLLAQVDERASGLTPALKSCLQPWLRNHIRAHDVPLYRAVEAGGKTAGVARAAIH